MKALTRLGILCGIFVALLCLSGIMTSLSADPNSANVFKDFGCQMSLAALGAPGQWIYTEVSQAVVTSNGTTRLTCHGEIPEALRPDKAVIVTDEGCGTQGGTATAMQKVFTPSGNAKLTCWVKKD